MRQASGAAAATPDVGGGWPGSGLANGKCGRLDGVRPAAQAAGRVALALLHKWDSRNITNSNNLLAEVILIWNFQDCKLLIGTWICLDI